MYLEKQYSVRFSNSMIYLQLLDYISGIIEKFTTRISNSIIYSFKIILSTFNYIEMNII